ncbi:MAG: ATP:cob(I)alamin adenosyltransferase [Sorangiineae bacterium NIC37A_2]|jgi:cob(I)alamin adenosyltransferase|nr:MAG: ATP:cob(I)alamin adenosyltransferase [Sorangiineae bacterium NIC37A_2]
MKIYTKTGDAGETGLFGGERVGKGEARVEVYGTVDELNAALGLACVALDGEQAADLQGIQRDLFVLGAELACAPGAAEKLRLKLIDRDDIEELEALIDRAEAELPKLMNFILPGGSEAGARLHLARAVCRRAEREFFRVASEAGLRSELGVYLNRLSDLLFVLARRANARAGAPEVTWSSRSDG